MDSINAEGGRDFRFGYNVEPPSPSPTPSPRAPALVISNSDKCLSVSNSGKALVVSNSGKALVVSNSGKRIDQYGRKKYVKQVTGRHNDTELHLAAQKGDVAAVRLILGEINDQMLKTLGGAEFDAEVAEIRAAVVSEVNELGETPLFTAAEKGFVDVVEELLQYTTREGIRTKNTSGFDPLHIAASRGHREIVQILLDHDPELSKTFAQSNATPLISAATKGHLAVVKELLAKDSSLLEIPRSNGKNALHLAARQGHVDIVRTLLEKDPQLARRTDKKGQTALHMAVKGVSWAVVKLLLQADAAIVMLPDKFGCTALHIATRKKRIEGKFLEHFKPQGKFVTLHHTTRYVIVITLFKLLVRSAAMSRKFVRHCNLITLIFAVQFQIVNELLRLRGTNVNALNRDQKTALDIAESLPLSEEIVEIKECLNRYGAVRANELNQSRDELRITVSEIKKDIHTQLEQARKTNKNVDGIAKELRKLHREGINNATNSVTVVASLFATVAFAAIFTVPGGNDNNGRAVMVSTSAFKVFFFTNAVSLFTSLAVVVVQITVVRGETKSERRVVEVINKLMWLASVCTSVAFIASSYIVVGRRHQWAAVLVTLVGAVTMAGVLGAMTYYVVKSKRLRRLKKKEKYSRSGTCSWQFSETDTEINPIFAI